MWRITSDCSRIFFGVPLTALDREVDRIDEGMTGSHAGVL